MEYKTNRALKLKSAIYLTPEQFRRHIGCRSVQTIYSAIHGGRIVPKPIWVNRIWLIESSSVMLDRRIKHGAYIGLTKKIEDGKKLLQSN